MFGLEYPGSVTGHLPKSLHLPFSLPITCIAATAVLYYYTNQGTTKTPGKRGRLSSRFSSRLRLPTLRLAKPDWVSRDAPALGSYCFISFLPITREGVNLELSNVISANINVFIAVILS